MTADVLTFSRDDPAEVFLTITHDGRIVIGPGLSMEEATQKAAQMLADNFHRLTHRPQDDLALARSMDDPNYSALVEEPKEE